jgi:hypothetical protein
MTEEELVRKFLEAVDRQRAATYLATTLNVEADNLQQEATEWARLLAEARKCTNGMEGK